MRRAFPENPYRRNAPHDPESRLPSDLGAEDITAIDKALDTLEARFARPWCSPR